LSRTIFVQFRFVIVFFLKFLVKKFEDKLSIDLFFRRRLEQFVDDVLTSAARSKVAMTVLRSVLDFIV